MTFQGAYEPVQIDVTARPWLITQPCQAHGCVNLTRLYPCGWRCGNHVAKTYVQGDRVCEVLELGAAMMRTGINPPRPQELA